MSFREPLWLLGLLTLVLFPLFDVFAARRQRARFDQVGHGPTVARMWRGKSPRRTVVRSVLRTLGVALLAIAAAGPRFGNEVRVLQKRGVDLMVALDVSKSMLAEDIAPNRIGRVRAELVRLFETMDGDRVGIVAFAGDTMEFPMTLDYGATELFLRDLHPYDMPVGGTAIGRALEAARLAFERQRERPNQTRVEVSGQEPAAQVVLLFTDGEDHEGDPVAAARALADDGVTVFVVGLGTRSGEPIPRLAHDRTRVGYVRDRSGQLVLSALTAENEEQLRAIAEATGGRYFHAPMGDVPIDEVRRALHSMHTAERASQQISTLRDQSVWFALPALLLLFAELGISVAQRAKRPVIVEEAA